MKIFLFFIITFVQSEIIIEERVGAKCGCGSLNEELKDNPYKPIYTLGYHQILKQQMLHFSKVWANKLKGIRIGKGEHQKVVEDIIIEEFKFNDYEIKKTKRIFFKNFQFSQIQNEDWTQKEFQDKDKIQQFLAFVDNEDLKNEFSQELQQFISQCQDSTDILTIENCLEALNIDSQVFYFGLSISIKYQIDQYSNWKIITALQIDKDQNNNTAFFFQPYLIQSIENEYDFYSQRVDFYEALKQVEYYKSKNDVLLIDNYLNKYAIKFPYNGFFTHANQNELVTSCRFGFNIIKQSIQMILQLKEFPTMKFNFCPKSIQLFEYVNSEFYLNEKLLKIIQEKEIDNADIQEELKEFNQNMSFKDFPVNLEYRYQDQIDKVYYDRYIAEQYDLLANSDVKIDCETFQRARQHLYFHDKQLLTVQYLNISPNFEIVCMAENSSQQSTTRGMVFYFDTLIGYIDFETYLSDTDPCKIPFVCIDFEANFGSQIVSQVNCQRKAELDINLKPDNVGTQQYFHHIVYRAGLKIIEVCINQLEILNSVKIGVYEFVHLFLSKFTMEIKGKQRKLELRFDSSFEQLIDEKDFFYIGNFKGGLLMGFFEKFEYSPIYFTLRDYLWQGYIQLEIRCGTQLFKVMFPNQIFLKKQEVESLQQKIIKIGIKDDYVTKRKELYEQFMQFKIHEEFGGILVKYFEEIIHANQNIEYNTLFSKVIQNEDSQDIIFPKLLQGYMDSGFIGFPVIVATFNYIIMNFSFDRLSTLTQFDIKTMMNEFNLMIQNKNQSTQNQFWDKYCDINGEIDEKTYSEEFPSEQKNNLGFNDLSQWIYVLESQEQEKTHDLGYLEYHLEDGFDRLKDETVIKFSTSMQENLDLIMFDLQYLKEKQILFNNNYFLGLFGNNEFHRKMIFEVFYFNYTIMSVIQLKLQTENFTSEFILPINSYVDLVMDFKEIVKNAKNHGLIFEFQSEKTLTNQRSVSMKQIYKSLLKVFKDITVELIDKQKDILVHDRLVRLCQDGQSYPLGNSGETRIIDIREYKYESIEDNIFEGQCKTDQNQNFMTIEEQEDLIVVNIYEFRKFQNILKAKKLGQKITRNFISTYTFHRKAAYNMLPIFERQMYCLIYHVFLGKFCEKELHWQDFAHEVNLEKHHKILEKKAAENKLDNNQIKKQQIINELISSTESNVNVNMVTFQRKNRRIISNHVRKKSINKLTQS